MYGNIWYKTTKMYLQNDVWIFSCTFHSCMYNKLDGILLPISVTLHVASIK